LRACLDHSAGAEVSTNLDLLYEYMAMRLLSANAQDNGEWMDEVASLMREVKSGWDEIPSEARALRQADPEAAVTGRAGGSNMVIGSC
jgi:flagellar protein FliS